MGVLHFLVDTFLHLDRHLAAVIAVYHIWIYGIVFVLIFAETGLVVVTPFLPGDSLLFAIGALAAVGYHRDPARTADVGAGVCGRDPRAIPATMRLAAHRATRLSAACACCGRNICAVPRISSRVIGAATILLSRFLPLLRTFAPLCRRRGTDAFCDLSGL